MATAAAAWLPVSRAAAQERPRLVVLTDIGGDPDDMQSMRRLLLYANQIEIAGLIASASGTPREVGREVTRPELIRQIVDDYARVHGNLRRHDARYPHPDLLRAVIRSGSPRRGVEHLGPGRATEGSEHIVRVVDAAPGPVHVAIWGGAHDLAQALHDVHARRSPAETAAFLEKLRVYAIADQDAFGGQPGTGEWIRERFPALRYVETGPPGMDRYGALFRGMYQNDSRVGRGPVLPLVPDSLVALTQEGWVEAHVRTGHGALGAGYPQVRQNPGTPRNTTGVKEGDTPSWFFVLPNGLSNPEHPEYGGWGGRFERRAGGHFTDAEDDHWSGTRDAAVRRKWTVARWRAAYQNDFAARMDWTVKPFADANHAPVAVVDSEPGGGVIHREAAPGERLVLDAGASSDPDGDRLAFRWSVYREASSYPGEVRLERSGAPRVVFRVPRDAAGTDIHLVLEVFDDGEPRLVGYRRVVVRVAPPGGSPAAAAPVRLIFDTDMDTDCDDAGALAMLHAMADAGEVELLATVVSSHFPWSAAAVDAINTYYGRPDLPIGVPKDPGAPVDRGSRYARQIAAEFPRDVGTHDQAPDAVEVYRRILASQPDTSVVIVTVGYTTNIRYLLESGPDRWSPLSGMELARRKVRRWVAMGGTIPAHTDPRVYGNFKPDAESTVIAVRDWPRPLILAGDEIGDHLLTGETLAATPPSNPVRRTYELYFGAVGRERPSWDQTAVLHAVRPDAGFWREVSGGYHHIFENGTSEWRPGPVTNHSYLVQARPAAEIEAVIERLMSRPPSVRGER